MRGAILRPIILSSAFPIEFARHAPSRVASPAGRKVMRFGAVTLLATAALLLAGWGDPPTPLRNKANPADPRAPVPPVLYRSTIGPYRSRRPVEPAPWSEQNQRVAPQPKSGR